MAESQILKVSPAQVQALVGISRDTLRHWRTKLVPIINRNGRRNCFSMGDVAAIATVDFLINNTGVGLRHVQNCSEEIFGAMNESSWLALTRSGVMIRHTDRIVTLTDPNMCFSLSETWGSWFVPLDEVLGPVQERLLGGRQSAIQEELPFLVMGLDQ